MGIAHSVIITVTSFSKMVRVEEKKGVTMGRLEHIGEPRDGDGEAWETELS